MNFLALLVDYGVPFPYYLKHSVVAVFHNSNHYGYYIAFALMTSALLFIYETKPVLKVILFCSVCLGTVMIVINNTLGAFLATGFVLTLVLLYTILDNRRKSKNTKKNRNFKEIMHDNYRAIVEPGAWQSALFILLFYVCFTLALNTQYHTVVESLIRLFSDTGDIVKDSEHAGGAGSGRWKLWKNTCLHIPEHPFVGFGVEGLLNTYHVGTPHNEILQYAAFFGIPVTVLYLASCILVLVRVWINKWKVSKITMICFFLAIGYLVNSMFGVAIYYTTPFMFIFLGLAYSECVREDDSAKG